MCQRDILRHRCSPMEKGREGRALAEAWKGIYSVPPGPSNRSSVGETRTGIGSSFFLNTLIGRVLLTFMVVRGWDRWAMRRWTNHSGSWEEDHRRWRPATWRFSSMRLNLHKGRTGDRQTQALDEGKDGYPELRSRASHRGSTTSKADLL